MNCDEAKRHFETLTTASADTHARSQVESHLSECSDCMHNLDELQHLDARLISILKTGKRTPELWDRIETMVLEEPKTLERGIEPRPNPNLTPWELLRLAAEGWLAGKSLATRVTSGCLAGIWGVILLLNMSSHTFEAQPGASDLIAPGCGVSAGSTRQHLMAVELAAFSEPVEKPKHDRPAPRTQQESECRSV